MNYSTAIFLVNDDARAVATSYERDKDGNGVKPWKIYKTLDHSLQVGDLVVVPSGTRHDRTVVRVEELNVEVDPASSVPMDWIIDVVDETAFKAVEASEQAGIQKIKSAEKRRAQEELREKLLADNPDLNTLANLGAPAALPAPPAEGGA